MTDSTLVESKRADGSPAGIDARAELLAVVADPVRLGLLDRLAAEGTRCVCDLQTEPPIPGNLLSYHLRVLREAGLVTTARRGRWVDYTLAGDALDRLASALPGGGRYST